MMFDMQHTQRNVGKYIALQVSYKSILKFMYLVSKIEVGRVPRNFTEVRRALFHLISI